jgi:hypothetical protein
MMITNGSVWRRMAAVALLIALLAAASHQGLAQGSQRNPGIIPPNAQFRGLSYQDLEARFWQTLLSIPVVDGDHPLFSGGPIDAGDGIVFLAAPFGGAELDVTISAGTALFFPIVDVECSELEPDPFHGDDEEEQRACANDWMDQVYDLTATIDGRSVNNLATAYRFESKQFVMGPLPENNVFEFFGLDAPAGTTTTAVDAGYYLFLAPLSVGEHEIHITGKLDPFTPDDDGDDFLIDTTFHITVTP